MKLLVRCPAKLNRFLRIEPPDAAGYHPLHTEFQTVVLCDELWIEPGDPSLTIEGPEARDLAEQPDNTVLKALRLLRELGNLPNLKLRLVKNIPSEAGLGGGSSDAAGILRAAKTWLKTVPHHEFAAVAKGIGADVPFFLTGGRARAQGYGELLTPLEDQPPEPLVIALPEVRCPTPQMYRLLDASRIDGEPQSQPEGWIENDFHLVAPKACLEAIERLRHDGLSPVGLAGSGSAVFGFAQTREQAEAVANALRGEGIKAWATVTLGRSESLQVQVNP